MSVVGSSLSGEQERKLLSLFNNVRLHLLYKASVHGYMHQAFHNRCDGQGPTILVAYNKTGFIFGGYISKDYAGSRIEIHDDQAFLYSITNQRDKPLCVFSSNGRYGFIDGDYGLNVGVLWFLNNNTATVQQLPGNSYIFEPEEMHGNDLQLTECEVYRVEQRGDILEKPWRNINWEGFSTKQRLMDYIQNYKPEVNSVVQARVLLVGPVGAGKSSFFNSINSVFKGHVTGPANSGSAGTSLTTQFRTYNIKAGQDRSALPLVLCDTMGLEEGLGAGLDIDDITSVLKGHIQDRYQFNPSTSIQSDSSFFCKSPSLKDRIHCVVYVLDACKISLISAKMVDKFTAIRKIVNKQGVPLLVLLTKVDEACPLVKEDLTNIYISHYIEKMIREVSLCIGVSQSCVVPVKNYSREFELDVNTDILLLSAVVQMLRYTDDYFDDLYQAGDQRPETPDS
ncbi:interferon-induced protein 44-like isoform X1 [Esox lucius]|uniref:TLDc domain-containing protein n=1 Tax=Esox lucius TaxID=8010 RepID=A0AAY5KWC5_ESOLU|nr:interferon-induced protein 44-like isoform X1 [Esox lucius]XP_010863700.1 interferon-induced protein 44-like isoform X1 [Esox lucius]XP_010863702.1 interferon-induced protein 44-like isoform X1 [Esox lucius]